MATNEQKGLDALILPSDLTLGKLARLERIKSPLLAAEFSSLVENLKALYAVSVDAETFCRNADDIEPFALAWADDLKRGEYEAKLDDLCKGLVMFGVLMPRPDEDAKKNDGSVTDGSSSSQSGVAETTTSS